jgi:hypothetical protein
MIVPRASHSLLAEKPDVVNRLILDFLRNDPPPTMMPLRRTGRTTAEQRDMLPVAPAGQYQLCERRNASAVTGSW